MTSNLWHLAHHLALAGLLAVLLMIVVSLLIFVLAVIALFRASGDRAPEVLEAIAKIVEALRARNAHE